MKNITLLFCLAFLFQGQIGYSQIDKNILTQEGGKYYYQDKAYKKKNLGPLMSQYEIPNRYYKKYKKANTRFKYSAISSLTLAAGAAILFNSSPNDCDGFCPQQETAVYIAIGSVLIYSVAIVSFPIARKNFKRSIKSFNTEIGNSPEIGGLQYELNLNYTGNGIGLVFNF